MRRWRDGSEVKDALLGSIPHNCMTAHKHKKIKNKMKNSLNPVNDALIDTKVLIMILEDL